MVTSSFTYLNNYKKPLAEMDFKAFGKELVVWDFRERKPLQTLKTGGAPLETRWALKEGTNHGYTNCLLDNSIWVWEGAADGKYTTRKLCDTGALPADLRQSPDDRYLYVSCFGSNDIQQWDVSDLKNPKLASTIVPGGPPEHDARDRRRQADVHQQLPAQHRRPLEPLLGAAGAHRPGRHEDGPILQCRPDQIQDRPGAGTRHAAVLRSSLAVVRSRKSGTGARVCVTQLQSQGGGSLFGSR
jgi:hypothetical protein